MEAPSLFDALLLSLLTGCVLLAYGCGDDDTAPQHDAGTGDVADVTSDVWPDIGNDSAPQPDVADVAEDASDPTRPRTQLQLGELEDDEADDDPTIIATDEGIHMLFLSDRLGESSDILATRTVEAGGWVQPTVVSDHPDTEWYPTLKRDDSGVYHCAWTRIAPAPDFFRHIIYNRSDDGLTWDDDGEVSLTVGVNDDAFPNLVTVGTDVRIYFSGGVRTPGGSQDLYVMHSWDGGDTWGAPQQLVGVNSSDTEMFPWVEPRQDGFDMVFVRWPAAGAGNIYSPETELWVSSSSDGVTWDSPVRVTNNDAADVLPSLWIDPRDGSRHLIWISADGDGGQVFDAGVAWADIADYPQSRVDWTADIGASGWSPRVVPTNEPSLFFMITVSDDTVGEVPRLFSHWFRR